MIVVSDTSPVTALLKLGEIDLLYRLFGQVVIPVAVQSELLRTHSNLPSWIRVEAALDLARVSSYRTIVDPGEAEAIELAQQLGADRLLIDDAKGRVLAQREGLHIIGLVGVVLLAKTNGLIPLACPFIDRLRDEADVYLSEAIITEALKSVGE